MAPFLRILGIALGAALCLDNSAALAQTPPPVQQKMGPYNGSMNRAAGDALYDRSYSNAIAQGQTAEQARQTANATVGAVSAAAPQYFKQRERSIWGSIGSAAGEGAVAGGLLCVGATAIGAAATLGLGSVSMGACPFFAIGAGLAAGVGAGVHNLMSGDPPINITINPDPRAPGTVSGAGVPKTDQAPLAPMVQTNFVLSRSTSSVGDYVIAPAPGHTFNELEAHVSQAACYNSGSSVQCYEVMRITSTGQRPYRSNFMEGAVTKAGNIEALIDMTKMTTANSCPTGNDCWVEMQGGEVNDTGKGGSTIWRGQKVYESAGKITPRRFTPLSQAAIVIGNALHNPALQPYLDSPLNDSVIAALANALWANAAIPSGGKAQPFNANQPVTPGDVRNAVDGRGYAQPTIRSLAQPMTPDGISVPLGSNNPTTQPVTTSPVTSGGSNPSTGSPTLNLGNPSGDVLTPVTDAELGNPFSSFQSTLSAPFQNIVTIGDSFSTNGQCPAIDIPAQSIMGYTLSAIHVDEHCGLFEKLRTIVGITCMLGAIFVGIRVLMEA